MPTTSDSLHHVWRREPVSGLAVTEENCVGVDDFDSWEVLRANLRQINAHSGNGGLTVENGQHTHVARNRHAVNYEWRRGGTRNQQTPQQPTLNPLAYT